MRKLKLRFEPGEITATPGALDAFVEAGESPVDYLLRHLSGDWGALDEEDKRENERAVKDGSRMLSAYNIGQSLRVRVITEADRSATTFLLPDEY